MVYQQKVPDKNLWTNEVIIHSSIHSFENASILSLDDNIIIYWIREGVIYCNTGNQSGNSWGKPLKYNYPANKQFVCMFYKTNNIYEEERIAAKDIPGSFIGGLKFAFYQQSSVNGDNLSVEELKTLILDSLKLLKTSVEELKETDNNFMEEIAKLNNRYDELEKELVKCYVKSNYLETQLSQTKSFNTRLDTVSSELRQIRSHMDMTDQNTIIKLT
jgi:FtsZ-binding cell division protein ZapB